MKLSGSLLCKGFRAFRPTWKDGCFILASTTDGQPPIKIWMISEGQIFSWEDYFEEAEKEDWIFVHSTDAEMDQS